MIGYWDSDLRNVIANEAYVEWFGLSPQKLKGMHISEIVGETIYQQNLPYMEAALARRAAGVRAHARGRLRGDAAHPGLLLPRPPPGAPTATWWGCS